MTIKKRIIALCLATTAALSLMFAAPAKQIQHSVSGQATLLCEFYEDCAAKRC